MLVLAALLASLSLENNVLLAADERLEFFERRVRPVLVEHCESCHGAESDAPGGGLRLDLRAGWQAGGESGEPTVVPGQPEHSQLIRAIRHDDGVSAMPPDADRLPAAVIADLEEWIRQGAVDPREGAVVPRDGAVAWESTFRERLDWWSLRPLAVVSPPMHKPASQPPATAAAASSNPSFGSRVDNLASWPRNEIDRFILASLQEAGRKPVPRARPAALARRVSLALTGLPPAPERVLQLEADTSPEAFGAFVEELLESPHYGERWARHWMDVVHYADTHGYEWDVPAKNAWRYRDYLVRAYNQDVSYQRMILEQLAGDLIAPRINRQTGVNESLIGPMMLRLGERRHGDNAAVEGVGQEAISNTIDTVGKAFLGTTLACAQCHHHKLDAVGQHDYYALAGVLMSSRFSARSLETADPNAARIDRLRELKRELRAEMSRIWLAAAESPEGMAARIRAIAPEDKPADAFPTSLAGFWRRSLTQPVPADEFRREADRRRAANRANLTLVADFTRAGSGQEGLGPNGWQWDGLGMRGGLVADGELVVTDEGETVLQHLLPAGRFSHAWSQRLAGSLQSPQYDPTQRRTISLEMASGQFASLSFIVDRALNPERMAFPNLPLPTWHTQTAGNFDTLEGSIDERPRRVYLEIATKSLNNYFPPRIGYGGSSAAAESDPRSWFGVTRVYEHAAGQGPVDGLERFDPLFADHLASQPDWALRLVALVREAVGRWRDQQCSSDDVRLLNDALQLGLLPNDRASSAEAARLVDAYRQHERQLQADQTVGSIADWDEGSNERLGVRGSYTELGEEVERAAPRLLGVAATRERSNSSGRLELARQIASDSNPLTARVYVNRVWHYLFGEGLVRTPDDFGHLGQPPTHPELLDYLAGEFIREGWSTKQLIRRLVMSATWQQQSVADPEAVQADPENRLWHHRPMQRLEAEAIRDSMLFVSGRLDVTLAGPPVEPHRTAEDSQKRLFCGPLDGEGRRSLYLEMTLMEPPRFLAIFNQPLPKQTVGRRDVTNVPDQALALLNDPFVVAMAKHWSERQMSDGATSVERRAAAMLQRGLSREPRPDEVERLVRLVERSVELHAGQSAVAGAPDGGAGDEARDADTLLQCQPAWQDAAHAIFNLKEFVYVP
jgi:mono/diheme cytochrome c family protein